jgi:hypothetical protein
MSEELTKYGEATNLPAIKQLEQFQMLLNKEPDSTNIKKAHDAKGGGQYLPIGAIENLLDETYNGLWQSFAKVEQMGNSIVATVHLRVFHPIASAWLNRTGVGAIRLQLEKGSAVMDASSMKGDAFEKGVGTAKSVALRNAAASLGVVFGRNLNRKDLEDYEYTTIGEQADGMGVLVMEALCLVESSTMDEGRKVAARKKINKTSFKALPRLIEYLNTLQP